MKSIVYTIAFLSASAQCYKLTFYDSGNGKCDGRSISSWDGGPEKHCNIAYSGPAQDVLIERTDSGDDDNKVQFFDNDNCFNNAVIAEAEAGASAHCVTIHSSNIQNPSFRIVDKSDNTASLKGEKQLERDVDECDAITLSNSMHNSMRDDGSIRHGDIWEFKGQVYRYHQLAKGAWTSVPIEEWDDNIHIANDTELDFSENGEL
ncbi:hypothetical protein ASPWEDRAFT_39687 [Aspergillus wentii DTO 134E9]|uniref:Uncharacterized protein n=1 Tax=Aspergillus wentii DTO 134E9 TaxID=1073089 RepID=A0A1L9RST0_ASPWE|nr:uncharacterized protein ASPWEDRAFT_39687 [Aspergillus wentii DTO 134E9]OJJ37985.1 hypothetical protein ASPWEDRAFT_39687 [Aspergillus wentii DTO 134E9]